MMNLWESCKLEAEELCQNTSDKHVALKAFIESPCKNSDVRELVDLGKENLFPTLGKNYQMATTE